jgi:hypothetical protein
MGMEQWNSVKNHPETKVSNKEKKIYSYGQGPSHGAFLVKKYVYDSKTIYKIFEVLTTCCMLVARFRTRYVGRGA